MKIPTAALPMGMPPKPEGFSDVLADGRQIADYVITITPGEVDEEMIEEFFRGCSARLVYLPIDQIKPGPADNNIRVQSREKAYAKMPLATMPPLIIENGELQDGHHRWRVAKAAGAKGLWCYELTDESLTD